MKSYPKIELGARPAHSTPNLKALAHIVPQTIVERTRSSIELVIAEHAHLVHRLDQTADSAFPLQQVKLHHQCIALVNKRC